MGAWGTGMQANDTALDAIGAAGLSCGDPKREKKTLAELRSGKRTVKSLFTKEGRWCLKEPQGILGLAEYLLDEGFDLSSMMKTMEKALKHELCKAQLDCWRDSEERKAALRRFRDRLRGKKVDPELLAQDNEGLLSKMSRVLGVR